MNKKIILMCDSLQRFNFIRRVTKSLDGCKVIIVTGEPIVKLKSFLAGFECHYLRSKKINDVIPNDFEDSFKNSIEYLNGEISLKQCLNDAISAISIIDEVINKHGDISHVIIWNGQQLLGRIMTKIANKHNIKTIYLEISNLPNKLFVDAQGVNALSSLAKDKNKISSLDSIDNERHKQWVEKYKVEKRKPLPQASVNYLNYIESFFNRVLKKITKGIGLRQLTFLEMKNKYNFSKANLVYDNCTDVSGYIFLPLQVTSDTQLKLHSKYNNIQAIEYAVQLADKEGIDLVVKPHPAERNFDEIKKVLDLKKKYDFYLSNEYTVGLIERSKCVLTINSTVGLEALIFGKNVTVLGDAFYSDFTQDDLSKYIHSYLLDGIDVFSSDEISKDKALELFTYAS